MNSSRVKKWQMLREILHKQGYEILSGKIDLNEFYSQELIFL